MRQGAWVAPLLLLGAIAFNLIFLWPEVAVEAPPPGGGVLHLPLVARAVEAMERGEDPTDPWISYFALGYPLFHHYPHLPHLATALLDRALAQAVPLGALFNWVRYLLLATFPLSVYWAGRRLGFGARPAALAGTVASLLATEGLLGLDMLSYIWRGYGLYTQLWGMWLLGPAVAGLYVTLSEGRAYAGTAALLAATTLSHGVLGYVALLSGLLLVVISSRPVLRQRVLRLALVLLLVVVLASYFLVPFFLDRADLHRGLPEGPGSTDGYDWARTLEALVTGRLLDYGRLPALTVLAGLGFIVCLFRWRQERYRVLLAFFAFWLLVYLGRPTWGVLLNLLPMGRELDPNRLIAAVHLGAIGLAGCGLAWVWERGLSYRQRWPLAVAAAITLGLLVPAYYERAQLLETNGQRIGQNAAGFAADQGAMDALLSDLGAAPAGRVYAGTEANWGKDYRIGGVPVYALLAQNCFDSPGYPYDALSLNIEIEDSLEEDRWAAFNLLNLRYVVAPEGQAVPSFARLQATYGRHHLYEVPTTGYFDLVDSEWTLYGDRSAWLEAAQAWLQSGWVEARQHPAIVFGPASEDSPAALPLQETAAFLAGQPAPQQDPCGTVLGEEVAGNSYTATFQAERSCWLLLKAAFHPGWQVTIDGRPAPARMLAPSFVGVAVEPGQHQATFRYTAGPLRPWLGAAGLGILLLAVLAEWQRQRWAEWTRRALAPLSELSLPVERAWERLRLALSARWHREWKWVAALLAFVLLTGLPALQLKQMTGHDALEYLPRTAEFYRGLQEGQVFPRWAPDFSRGYGQPFFLFSPPLVYYVASAFHALGISLVASLNLTCLALLALAGLGMYHFGREFFGQAGGLAAAVGYILAPFTLVNLYVRYSLTDLAAMGLIPWALWGLWRWTCPTSARTPPQGGGRVAALLVAAASVALILLSSNPVALVAIPALALYVVYWAARARSWRVLGSGAWAIVLGLGLSALFWLPALLERHWVKIGTLLVGQFGYQKHFVYLHQLLYSPWGFGLSLPGPDDGMSFGLGLAQLLALAVAIVLARALRAQLRDDWSGWGHFWFFIYLLALAVFLVTDNSFWLWETLHLLQYLEYPWRILVLATVATAFLCGFPFLAAQKLRRRTWLLAVVLGGVLVTGIIHAHPEGFHDVTDADYRPEVIAQGEMPPAATQEYEPVSARVRPESPVPSSRLFVTSGQVRLLESHTDGTRYEWLLEADGPAQLRVATFYFPGWQLKVDGQPRPLAVQHPNGLMAFELEGGTHRVEVTFARTPLRGAAVGISAGALLLLVLTALQMKRR